MSSLFSLFCLLSFSAEERYFAGSVESGYPMIAQYFNLQSQRQEQRSPQSIDEFIIQRRREIELRVDKKTE
jgi:hypothetical protein